MKAGCLLAIVCCQETSERNAAFLKITDNRQPITGSQQTTEIITFALNGSVRATDV
jgi:hypothetical protein